MLQSTQYYIDRRHKKILYSDQEFKHHGVLGQKWGVITKNVGVNYIPIGRKRSSISKSNTPSLPKATNYIDTESMPFKNKVYKELFKLELTTPKDHIYNINDEKKMKYVTKLDDAIDVAKIGLTAAGGVGMAAAYVATQGTPVGLGALYSTSILFTAAFLQGVMLQGKYGSTAKEIKEANKAVKDDNKRRSELPVDKETGFHLKNQSMTSEEDMKYINPGFKNYSSGTKSNCGLCSVAYDMRQRGYDVRAKELHNGVERDYIFKLYPGAKYTTIFDNSKIQYSDKINADMAARAISKIPNNTRGIIGIDYKTGGGHAIAYDVKDNKFTFRDCQSNTAYSINAFRALAGQVSAMEICRLDNLDFNTNMMKEAVE